MRLARRAVYASVPAACLAVAALAGVAAAGPLTSGPAAHFATLQPTAGAGGWAALAAAAAAPSRPCAGSGGSCESTDPTFYLEILAVGNSSACTYSSNINWGDGTSTSGALQGGPDGARLRVGSYTYKSPGTYTISLSITPNSGGVCGASFSLGTTFTWEKAAIPGATGPQDATRVAPFCHSLGDPVNTATGVLWETQTDVAVPGHGVPLELARTYSASDAGKTASFGHGWTSSYDMSLSLDATSATVSQENGAPATFYKSGSMFLPSAGLLGSLVANSNGTYTFTRYATNVAYVFNAAGRLIAANDRNGYATTFSYDAGGDLTKVTDAAGRALTLAHAGGHVVSATDPVGNKTSYTYDTDGNLTRVTDPMGGTRTFTYDADHLLLSATDPNGGTSTNTYDDAARVTKQVDPAGRTMRWAYTGDPASGTGGTTSVVDARGTESRYRYEYLALTQVTAAVGTAEAATTSYEHDPGTFACTKITEPNGHVTTRTFDARGDLLSTTDQLGHARSFTYDAQGDLLTATDARGTTTTYSYDARGNLLSASTPLTGGGTATWSYSYGSGAGAGDMLTATDPNGHTATFAYDAAGNRTRATDPLGHTTTASYDGLGRRTAATTPLGHRTTYEYDADGELTKLVDPRGGVTTSAYDKNGNRVSTTDADGRTTAVHYNAVDEPTEVIAPDGTSSATAYDANGNVTEQKDGNGHVTRYAYDPRDRVIASTDAKGRTTRYGYDAAGNQTSRTNPDGKVTTFTYDEAARRTGTAYADGATPGVQQEYDAEGRRTSLTDGTGTSTFAYDTLGRLVSETDGAGATVGYRYDPAGNQTAITYPNGQTVTRAFDAAGQLTRVSDWLGHDATFTYDADGNRAETQLPGGITQAARYDANGAVAEIADTRGGTALARFSYTRTATGQVASDTTTGAITATHHYTYDSNGRLAGADDEPYGYDKAGNPTTYVDGRTQAFDEAAQLTSSTRPPSATPEPPPAQGGGGSASVTRTPTRDLLRAATKVKRRSLVVKRLTTSAPGELLVALVSLGADRRAKPQVTRLHTNGVTWQRVATRRARGGFVGIWRATPMARLHNATLTAKLTKSTTAGTLSIAAYEPGTVVHASGGAGGSRSAPTMTLRAAPRAVALAVGSATKAARHRPASGTRIISQQRGGAAWLQTSEAAATAATIRIGDRTPLSSSWLMAGVVLAASDATVARATAAARRSGSLNARAADERTYTYNAQGARTGITNTDETAVALGYDQANRLTSISGGIGYGYNGDGLRASKTAGGTTTQFAWDESGDLPLLLQAGSTSYIYGPDGQPIAQITGTTPTYLLGDQHGSTRLLTDSSGTVVGTYSYDAWGNRASHTGTATTELQYNGQYTDAESGLIYLRARYYDPTTGQFMTRDPLVATTRSPYGYANNDPVNAADPTGENWIYLGAGGAAVACVGAYLYFFPPDDATTCKAAFGAPGKEKCLTNKQWKEFFKQNPDMINVYK